jgi:SAM-dependent methyltransferase
LLGTIAKLDPVAICRSHGDYVQLRQKHPPAELRDTEARLVTNTSEFEVQGYCAVCEREAGFRVDFKYTNTSTPNWRERLLCPHCGLNNRLRLSIHFLRQFGNISSASSIYMTEQKTGLYRVLKKYYPSLVGSEYLRDGTARGAVNAAGLRHEDLTDLSFPPNSLDFIGTFDVLEHVPDYQKAISECARCIRPGGKILITVPFNLNSETTRIRAKIQPDGSIEHLLPPQYHSDPLSTDGALCYQIFGWDLVGLLANAGFSNAAIYFFWSERFGYLGGLQPLIFGVKD